LTTIANPYTFLEFASAVGLIVSKAKKEISRVP
jgi:hypothetical protein